MKHQKINILTISLVTIIGITSIIGFQISDITAEETEEKGYKFARDTQITGTFSFESNEVELAEFEVFEQKSGFQRSDSPDFVLWKVVESDTPILHQAADISQKHTGNAPLDHNYNDFDVEILLTQGGSVVRQFNYITCDITNYAVETAMDKEEGWTGKSGFAVVEEYEFSCDGYRPSSPSYAEYVFKEKSSTTSSLDLSPTDDWSDLFK